MKIPHNAKKVFDGIIFDVFQWEQELFDGSTTTFEAATRQDSVLIIPTTKDSILLSYEEQPHFPARLRLFGGRIEEHEDPLTAGKRELLEETGLSSDDWTKFSEYNPDSVIQWKAYVYIARSVTKIQEPQPESGERIEVREHSFGDFVQLIEKGHFASSIMGYDLHMLTHNEKKLREFKKLLFG